MRGIQFVAVLLIIFCAAPLFAQDLKVRAGFINDSTRVGDEVLFYVSAKYPRERQVVFPDSSFIYSPFEFVRKSYLPTITKDSVSYDSAIFVLRTFEIDSLQTLRLPVYLVNVLDCTRVLSLRDTIAIKTLVKNLPHSLTADLPLKATTSYQSVSRQINYPVIIIVISFVLLFTAIGWVVFGKSVNDYFKKKRLRKLHEEFIRKYSLHVDAVRKSYSSHATESAVNLWKRHMEQITRRPYTKLTTKETALMDRDERLEKNLRQLDRAIYGHDSDVIEPLATLKEYANQRFERIISEVQNGK